MKHGAKYQKGTMKRLLATLFRFHPVALPLALLCIAFSAVVSAIPSLFMQQIIEVLEQNIGGDWGADVLPQILRLVVVLASLYVLSLTLTFVYSRVMAGLTQNSLNLFRKKLFEKMEKLPISYFDRHPHGDIMSHYTNDTDTLRQFISQSMPNFLMSAIIVLTLFSIMMWFSFWMTCVVLCGVVCMTFVIRKVGGNSAKYFIRQQKSMGETEGYVEEMIGGQKVIKVFCHEEETKAGFDAVNDKLFHDTEKANKYANILAPILMNIGNLLYVLIAMAGGIFLLTGVRNVSLSGLALTISVTVPFLNITRQFCGNINQVSQQINAVIMGLAGADRIFTLLDQPDEEDAGDVTLVNVTRRDGVIAECAGRTGLWAWKQPGDGGSGGAGDGGGAARAGGGCGGGAGDGDGGGGGVAARAGGGAARYTMLTGDIRLRAVNFGYEKGKPVLHDITLFAEPGQKVAFVGATGAGKTTITNLLNRFYDIAEGEIRYDGIDIGRIKKADLRRAIGLVLQDTNLFSGSVMDNIRYGRLDATDAECVRAATLAGAHDFITRLPEAYLTRIAENGSNLSQGQRQLLAIARAAVADPPVMVLDEATASIDTRTEAIVQRGMDALMEGRTVFVIAHRLSTVQNADVIMVLEDGYIIERGSHRQLIANGGRYYQLYTGVFELE
ncbi:MAG: ABC transporter ATP-binding protein/permease [Oscillospiraceae bacterium]|nr:ABC transporter ATP-binding protein/permease [Oscillospiraceae bacterium]